MKVGNKNIIIIFTGYNQRAVIAFLRTLKKNRLDNYAIIASSDEDAILKTTYSKKVLYVRKIRQLDLNEINKAIEHIRCVTNADKVLIAPSTEALNRFLLKYRENFEQHNCIIPLADEKLYTQISDKESFWKLCKESGFLVPEIVSIGTYYKVPIAVKPKNICQKKAMCFQLYCSKAKKNSSYLLVSMTLTILYIRNLLQERAIIFYITFLKTGNLIVFHRKILLSSLMENQ